MPTTPSTTSQKQTPTLLSLLIEQGVLTKEQAAVLPSGATARETEEWARANGLATDTQLLQANAKLYGIPFVRLKKGAVIPEVVTLIPEAVARRFDLAAYDKDNALLYVAIARPSQLKEAMSSGLLQRLQNDLHLKIAPAFALVDEVRALYGYYQQATKTTETADRSNEGSHTTASTATKTLPFQSLTGTTIDPTVLKKIPFEVAQKYQLVAFAETAPKQLSLAVVSFDDPELQQLIDFIEKNNDITVQLYQTDAAGYQSALAQYPEFSVAEASAGSSIPVQSVEKGTEKVSVNLPSVSKTVTVNAESTTDLPGDARAALTGTANSALMASAQPQTQPQSPVTQGITAVKIQTKDIDMAHFLANDPAATNPINRDQLVTPVLPSNQEAGQGADLMSFLDKPLNSVNDLAELVKMGNVPKIVAAALVLAVAMRASDIHIEATKVDIRLRYRIDGELVDILLLPRELLAPIVSRIKILSEMKIDENRIPQDGRFDVQFNHREIDVRVSTLPTVHGEKVVMRILDKTTGIMTLSDMGLDGPGLAKLMEAIKRPYGVVLATGPTGSGKSTTLYAILQEISRPEVNIVTLEDPVEYEIKGINQTQIKPKIGFTFAEGLRSILRQDPNVIMVGEIRDAETAEMVTHAALTGHLVLSTLHTNNAAGSLPRMINMGVEPFLITSSVDAIIGQRLVRRICPECKVEDHVPQEVIQNIYNELKDTPIPDEYKEPANWRFYRGKGCPNCHNGYRGRVGIFEVLLMSEAIEELAIKKEPESVIQEQAIKEGMITMSQDGLLKAIRGITTVEEILKAATE